MNSATRKEHGEGVRTFSGLEIRQGRLTSKTVVSGDWCSWLRKSADANATTFRKKAELGGDKDNRVRALGRDKALIWETGVYREFTALKDPSLSREKAGAPKASGFGQEFSGGREVQDPLRLKETDLLQGGGTSAGRGIQKAYTRPAPQRGKQKGQN